MAELEYRFEQDVERDAKLVRAGIEGGSMPLIKGMGWTIEQWRAHDDWLRQQPLEYMDRVLDKAYN